jgi:hypothetical protein
MSRRATMLRQHRSVQSFPCEYGERREGFDYQFKNKVDMESVMNKRISLGSPDYLDSELVEGKENLRDIESIPNIVVQDPTPEKVQLRAGRLFENNIPKKRYRGTKSLS